MNRTQTTVSVFAAGLCLGWGGAALTAPAGAKGASRHACPAHARCLTETEGAAAAEALRYIARYGEGEGAIAATHLRYRLESLPACPDSPRR